MKKKGIVLLLPVMLWAQMGITTHERVSTEAVPDVLRGELGFEEENKRVEPIREHFNAIVAALKRADPEARYCRGGGFHLSPRYSYKNQKQEFVGYGGTLSFGCEFPTIEGYNAVRSAVEKAVVPEVRVREGALSWEVSAHQRETVRRGLRLELIRKARGEAEAFSAETGMTCRPEKISYAEGGMPAPVMLRAMAASVPTESPIRADEEVSVEAAVDYSCVKRVP